MLGPPKRFLASALLIFLCSISFIGCSNADENKTAVERPSWPSEPKTKERRLAALTYYLENYDYRLSTAFSVPETQCEKLLADLESKNFEIIEPDLATTDPNELKSYEVFRECPELTDFANVEFAYAEAYDLAPYNISKSRNHMIYREGISTRYLPGYPYMICNAENANCLKAAHGVSINEQFCSYRFRASVAPDFIHQGRGVIKRHHGTYGLGLFGETLYHFVIPEEFMVRPLAEIAQTANAAFFEIRESIGSGGEIGCFFEAHEKGITTK